jgi:hypothetical protein
MYVKTESPDGIVTFTTIRVTPEEALIIAKSLRTLGLGHYRDEDASKAIQMVDKIFKSFTERKDG